MQIDPTLKDAWGIPTLKIPASEPMELTDADSLPDLIVMLLLESGLTRHPH